MITSGYGLVDLSSTVSLNLARSQGRLQADVSRLSSGLRIQTAADDPSGLAIAEGLQAKVNGCDQAVGNVQTATNALTVADGALQTVTDILQRLRSLCVEANDDLMSSIDRDHITNEAQQLQSELNTIAENTTFNGTHLLNRAPTTYAYTPAVALSVADSTFTTPIVHTQAFNPGGSSWNFNAYHTVSGGSGIALASSLPASAQLPPSGSAQVGFVQNLGSISQYISGFSAADSYAVTFSAAAGTAVGGETVAVLVDGTQIASYTPGGSATNWTTITTPSFNPGAGAHTISFQGLTAVGGGVADAYVDNVQVNSIATDSVNQTAALQIQEGADEGNAISLQLPDISTSNLGIAANTVATSTTAALFEKNIDTALATVENARAAVGAQMVMLQYQAENDSVASTNLISAESNIRDANIAQTATAFAAEQILSSIGTSVLANIKTLASSVETLFNSA